MRNLQFMCGRFVSAGSPDRIAAYFDPVVPTEVATESLGQNFNVAPTQDVYALVGSGDGAARLDAFHWGLVPSWAKDRKIGSRMINARAETLAEKPAFKGLLKTKRCIVPMDGFYEWKAGVEGGPVGAKGKPLKQPMFIHRADGDPLAVAGLWTRWKDPDDPEGRWLHSVTVITTAANATPMTTATASATRLPRSRNCLNSDSISGLSSSMFGPGTRSADADGSRISPR